MGLVLGCVDASRARAIFGGMGRAADSPHGLRGPRQVLVADPVVEDGHELRPPHAELVVVERGPHRCFCFGGGGVGVVVARHSHARACGESRAAKVGRKKGAWRGQDVPWLHACVLGCAPVSGGKARALVLSARAEEGTMVMASSAPASSVSIRRLGWSSGVGVCALDPREAGVLCVCVVTRGRGRELEEEEGDEAKWMVECRRRLSQNAPSPAALPLSQPNS